MSRPRRSEDVNEITDETLAAATAAVRTLDEAIDHLKNAIRALSDGGFVAPRLRAEMARLVTERVDVIRDRDAATLALARPR